MGHFNFLPFPSWISPISFNDYLFIYLFKFIYLFIFGCVGSSFLCEGFSLVVASRGHSSSRCAGLSLSRPLLLGSTGSRRAGSVIVAHGPSCSTACGIFPDQGSNPCPLHWQADSQPLRHQGSPTTIYYTHTPAPLTLDYLVRSTSLNKKRSKRYRNYFFLSQCGDRTRGKTFFIIKLKQ